MIILGSSSPRRIELLKTLITDFKIIKPSFDEKSLKKSNFHYALKESYFKAISIKNLAKPEDFLISCDNIFKYKNKILGKPSSISEATNYLKMLSNKTHKVISGVTIIYQNKIYKKEITTKVYFNNLTINDIEQYLKEEYVLDKAGAYAIQSTSKIKLVKKIKGSYTNVMGFPVEYIKRMLLKFNLIN